MKISKSKLLSFITCPQKYLLSYELGIRPKKRAGEILIGQSTHHAITTILEKRLKGEAFELEDLIEVMNDFWMHVDSENSDFDSEEEIRKAIAQSLDLVRLFLKETEDLSPQEVEYEFTLPVVNIRTGEELSGVELTGRIDLIDEVDGRKRAIEIKTRARRSDGFSAALSLELTVYAYWIRFLSDKDRVPVSYINIVKNRKPYLQFQNQERSTEDFVELFHTIKAVCENIADGRFYKNPGVHCNWCDYRPICIKDRDAVEERFGTDSLDLIQDVLWVK